MPRTARKVIDNSYYHIMCRGNNKTNIFHEDEDYLFFLELMVKCKIKYQINIHNFVF